MAFVTYVEPVNAPDDVKGMYEQSEQAFGALLNIFKASGHSPQLVRTLMAAFGGLAETKLDPKLRELAYIAASTANKCDY